MITIIRKLNRYFLTQVVCLMNTFFVVGITLVIAYLAIMTIITYLKNDNSIANFTWGGGCLLIALYTFFVKGLYLPRQLIITSLIVLWAGRLITYLSIRYTGKDPRFKGWNKQQGPTAFMRTFGYIFFLQGPLLLVMAYPIYLINNSTTSGLTALDMVGICLWIIGFFFESVGDYQLHTFLKNPENKGKVMRYGLWRYTRHPNYFGEVVMWWSIYLITLSVPGGWTAFITPITITVLLLFITGIPWTEQVLENNPEFQEYKKHTSIFFPWFVKK
jgi:steroid 5-alpha reductase family enzyme